MAEGYFFAPLHFHILTLFPEVFNYFEASILGRAQKKGLLTFSIYPLRDYATDKHKHVDDTPFGGGSGMVLKPDVVTRAIREIKKNNPIDRVILLSPRGRLLSHSVAKAYFSYKSLLFICGRYEGIDQRAIDLEVDDEISIGDYVLSGGELAAQVCIEVIARLIPGVVGDERGPQQDSHSNGLLEYPHYTRPAEFEGLKVPEVLLSGNHAEIEKWRKKESLKITLLKRPDLIKLKSEKEKGKTKIKNFPLFTFYF